MSGGITSAAGIAAAVADRLVAPEGHPMSTTATMTPCPPWCVDPADHNADDVAAGDDGRVHRSPDFGESGVIISLGFDDNPPDPSHMWECELDGHRVQGEAPAEVATGLRALAAGLTAAAAWLETQAPPGTLSDYVTVAQAAAAPEQGLSVSDYARASGLG